MCERYVIPDPAEVEREFGVSEPWWKFVVSFNVYPTRSVPCVRSHAGRSEGVMLRWGLIPDWAEADASKASVTHAPATEVITMPALRGAWGNGRRCIVPMFGFYAWQLTPAGYRRPFFVRLVNRQAFGVAALWDRSEGDDDDVIDSCALLTVPPNALMAEIQNTSAQMPAILRRKDYSIWLNGTPAAAAALLQPCPQDQMLTHAVSPRVNFLKYDDPSLIRPIKRA